jgi:hypothetical protein
MESVEEHTRNTFEVKKTIKVMPQGGKNAEKTGRVITIRSEHNGIGQDIVAFDFLQTKGLRYQGY